MPQMMPINWIFLFFLFICTFIIFNMMNYYISNIKNLPNKSLNKKMINNFFWKW